MKYNQRQNGDIIIIPRNERWHRIACCDCGLVHTFRFATKKNGEIHLQVWRNNRATAQYRRNKKSLVDVLKKLLTKLEKA